MAKKVKLVDEVINVGAGDEGRLDRFLTIRYPTWSRTSLQRLINKRFPMLQWEAIHRSAKMVSTRNSFFARQIPRA